MRTTFLLAALLLVSSVSGAFAGLDLTWNACNSGAPGGASNVNLDCATATVHTLFGNFQPPQPLAGFVGLDAVLDIHVGGAELPPFWHFETGGCDEGGLGLKDAKPQAECPSASNLNPWGTNGSAANPFITAFAPGYGGPGRAHLLLTVTRAASDPFPLAAGGNYYAFHLEIATDRAGACAGCGTAAEIQWTSASLYSATPGEAALTLTEPGLRSSAVTVNGGLGGMRVFDVAPELALGDTTLAITILGHGLVPGAGAKLALRGQPDIPGQAGVVAGDGHALTAMFDLHGAYGGKRDVIVTNPGGEADTLFGSFEIVERLRVDAIVPDRAMGGGWASAVILGGGMVPGASAALVRDGHQPVTGSSVVVAADGRSLTADFNLTYAAGGAWDVLVTNHGGLSARLAQGFLVGAGLGLQAITPTCAADSGAALVTLTGVGFMPGLGFELTRTGAAAVAAHDVSVAPDGQGASGVLDLHGQHLGVWTVRVANPDGGRALLPGAFSIGAIPVVSTIAPNQGGDPGTTAVRIDGMRFDPAARVLLRHSSGTTVTGSGTTVAADGTWLTTRFTLEGVAEGWWDVAVVNPCGLTGVLPQAFRVMLLPGVTAISPVCAADSGAATVTISGMHLMPGLSIELTRTGQAAFAAQNVIVAPDGKSASGVLDLRGRALGAWTVRVANPDGGVGLLSSAFSIGRVPVVSAITPTQWNDPGTTIVRIDGARFDPAARAFLRHGGGASIPGTGTTVAADGTWLTTHFAFVGVPPGWWDVVVMNPCDLAGVLPQGFRVVAPITVIAITPVCAGDSGAAAVTVTGTGFVPGMSLELTRIGQPTIGAQNVSVAPDGKHASGVLDLRGRATGKWTVRVANPDGGESSLSNAFSIDAMPVVTAINPNQGSDPGTTTVRIDGSRFNSAARALLRHSSGASVTGSSTTVAADGTWLTTRFTLAGVAGGWWDVVVVNPCELAGVLPQAFRVGSLPRVTAISPASAADTGSVAAAISGSGFQPGAAATLARAGYGDIAGAGTAVSPDGKTLTSTFDLRGRMPGVWDAVVANPDSFSGVLPKAFEILAYPLPDSVVPACGADDEVVAVVVHGDRFTSTAFVRLERGGGLDRIDGTATVVAADGRTITTNLDLRDRALGLWDVVVNNHGPFATLPGAFEIRPAPRVLGIVPGEGETGTQVSAVVRGRIFAPAATVRLARAPFPDIAGQSVVVFPGGDSLAAVFDLAGAAAGRRDVIVRNPDGLEHGLELGFAVRPELVIESVVPTVAHSSGPASLLVHGAGFMTGAAARLARAGETNIPGQGIAAWDEGTILSGVFDLTDRVLGLWDVVVVNPSGATATLPSAVEIRSEPFSGLDLTWNACNVASPPGAENMDFACGAPEFVGTLFGNFTSPATLPGFVAMDAVMDVEVEGAMLPPFWHYEVGGCNTSGLAVYDAVPRARCPGAGNATPWGPYGAAAGAFITAYGVGPGGTARLLLTVFRAASDPVTLEEGVNYYAFHLDFIMDNAGTCGGCETRARITWTSLALYGLPPGGGVNTISITKPGLRGKVVTVNHHAGGFGVSAIFPNRALQTNAVAVTIYGRDFLPGATAWLSRSGQANIPVQAVVASADGRTLTGTLDLTAAATGTWSVAAMNPGGSTAILTDGFAVFSILPEPTVFVLDPNGGEVFHIEAGLIDLRWRAVDDVAVTSVDLYLSRTGPGGPFEPIAVGQPGDAGVYRWLGTPPTSDQCYLKVVAFDGDGNTGEDLSDGPFTLWQSSTPIHLSLFEAEPLADGVELRWSFTDPSRFDRVTVERSETAAGGWVPVETGRAVEGGVMVLLDRAAEPGHTYWYRLEALTRDGAVETYGPISVSRPSGVTALALAVSPNPTRGRATITYETVREGPVRLSIVDLQGREVATVATGVQAAGWHQARWNGCTARGAAPAGVYFARLEAGEGVVVQRFVHVK